MSLSIADIRNLVELTINEDAPEGDITTQASIPEDAVSDFRIIAKEEMVACGAEIAKYFFSYLSDDFKFSQMAVDGSKLEKGDLFLAGKGSARAILTAERSALNVVQRLCGIATQTSKYVEILKGTEVKVLDTRKTTPGLRAFEKYAVRTGGGTNHRFGLSDMVMLKENHLEVEAANGGDYIIRSVENCRKANPGKKIEVEIRFVHQLEQAIKSKANIIMLDNMSIEDIKTSIDIIAKRAKIEVSGGITYETIKSYALPGVDFISVGSLTHSVKSSDLSLLIGE